MAQHNIWHVDKEQIKRYVDPETIGLSKNKDGEYVLEKHENFSYDESFAPFILCLFDSI